MSIVNKVEHALYTAASELISAANNPPASNPRKPTGINSFTSVGKAWSVFDNCNLPCCAREYAIIPGIIKIKNGNNFKYAAKMVPLLACFSSRPATQRCQIRGSVTQY